MKNRIRKTSWKNRIKKEQCTFEQQGRDAVDGQRMDAVDLMISQEPYSIINLC
jgi:hypothetical protein